VTEYWLSGDGILDRMGLLADDVRLGTFNNAVKVYGTAVGVTDLKISGGLTATSCEWCRMHVGNVYHYGMFMPHLPKHPNCVHWYDIFRIGSPPASEEGMLSWLFE